MKKFTRSLLPILGCFWIAGTSPVFASDHPTPDARSVAKPASRGFGAVIKEIADQTTLLLGDNSFDPISPENIDKLQKLFMQMKYATIYGIDAEPGGAFYDDYIKGKFELEEPASTKMGPSLEDPRVKNILKVCENYARFILKPSFSYLDIEDIFSIEDIFRYAGKNLYLHTDHSKSKRLTLNETEFSYRQRIMLERITLSYYAGLLKQAMPQVGSTIYKNRNTEEENYKKKYLLGIGTLPANKVKLPQNASKTADGYWKDTDRATKLIRTFLEANTPKITLPQQPTFVQAQSDLTSFINKLKSDVETLRLTWPEMPEFPVPTSLRIDTMSEQALKATSDQQKEDIENEAFFEYGEMMLSNDKLIKYIAMLLSDDNAHLEGLKAWAANSIILLTKRMQNIRALFNIKAEEYPGGPGQDLYAGSGNTIELLSKLKAITDLKNLPLDNKYWITSELMKMIFHKYGPLIEAYDEQMGTQKLSEIFVSLSIFKHREVMSYLYRKIYH